MATSIFRFLSIVLTGLISGIVLGIWMWYNPATFSYTTFLESQQGAIKGLNTIIPFLGFLAILSTLTSAFLQKSNKKVFSVLIIAAILLMIAGFITRLGNQPINSIVMTWNAGNVPANWTELREEWWTSTKSEPWQ